MDLIFFVLRILQLAATLFGFMLGAKKAFKKDGNLFLQAITMALGCAFLSECYYVTCLLAGIGLPTKFNVGELGMFGFGFFILAAYNVSGIKNETKGIALKYKVIPLIMPLLVVASGVLIYFSPSNIGNASGKFLVSFIIAVGSYQSLKYLLIKGDNYVITKALRKYNALLLLMFVMVTTGFVLKAYDLEAVTIGTVSTITILYALLLPTALGGAKKWSI